MHGTDIVPSRSVTTAVAFLRSLAARLFDSYRPELHYMRGPGPKWREKHERAAVGSPVAISALA